MRRSTLGFVVAAIALFSFAFGFVAAATGPNFEARFIEAKADMRAFLGLPKFWRETPSASYRKGRAPVACPDPAEALVIVTGGQSNAASTHSGPPVALAPRERVHTFFDGDCFVTRDPVLGASGNLTSIWPMVGRELAQRQDAPVVFVHGALGGTQAADWTDDRSGYFDFLEARVAEAAARGFEPDWIVWHQGETDAAVLDSAEQVRRVYDELTGRLLRMADASAGEGARIYLFRASVCSGARRSAGFPHLIEGMTDVARRNVRVHAGMNTDRLGRDFRHDGCHFNSAGKMRIVERLAGDLVTLAPLRPSARPAL